MICISYQDYDVKVHFAGEKKNAEGDRDTVHALFRRLKTLKST